ncbi:glycosyltransferase [Clostridium tyrobutyricum]|uniref:glycosyltransferase n=1 Tax=Clostridium tyrobutyricum TaxID=1519 RepID=UPI00164D54B6|nr:glycosyltransferase [Clostridium tyrobutyricum]
MKIAVVLVTFNRLDCLKIALKRYEEQIEQPEFLVVIDNASNDGTKEYLDEWRKSSTAVFEKKVIHMSENLGGSGGFSRGVEEASKLDCDFMFLADDDAYAEPDMLKELKKAYASCNNQKVAALCTAIYNYNEHEIMHRCVIKQGLYNVKFVGMSEENYKKDLFEVDILSFVGAAIKKDIVQRIGLPKKEYFIYFDDSEYCMRIRREGHIYCVPKSIMHHDVGHDRRSSWKDYYDTRNWIDLVKNYFPKRNYYGAIVKMYFKRCSILATIFRKRDKNHRKMCMVAIHDAIYGKLGVNGVYKPGTKL